jgi:type III secretory pathway component EscU
MQRVDTVPVDALLVHRMSGLRGCVAILVVAGVVDYQIRRRRYHRELSMSHEELQRELREDEGDPVMKAHRRAVQEVLSMEELVSRVRKARVVVVEPRGI